MFCISELTLSLQCVDLTYRGRNVTKSEYEEYVVILVIYIKDVFSVLFAWPELFKICNVSNSYSIIINMFLLLSVVICILVVLRFFLFK